MEIMSDYKYVKPDPEQEDLFKGALKELRDVAEKHGFYLKLIDDSKGTWYFYPEVDEDWKPE